MTDKKETGIIHVAPPQITSGGDFAYRLAQPDRALAASDGIISASITNIITDRIPLVMKADILVLQMLGDPDMLPVIIKRKKEGRPTVFEISDNFLGFQASNPAARFYEIPENRATLMQFVNMCDGVQVTTPALADIFAELNDNIRVFENRMETLGVIDKPGDRIRVGWGGSAGHLEDIRNIAPALKEWIAAKPENVVLCIMGDDPFRELFQDLPAERLEYRTPGTLDDYYDFVQTLDIGIAPLRDDSFNLCRSDVKFMEYASRGAVPVCSNIPTYSRTLVHGETGLLFSSTDEMISHIDLLVENAGTRSEIAVKAFRYIKENRMESGGAGARLDFYTQLSGGELKRSFHESDFDKNNSLKKTTGTSHYLHLMTESEAGVYNGMLCSRGNEGNEKLVQYFRQALKMNPVHFHAHLFLGGMLAVISPEEAAGELKEALEIFPDSCEARIQLALSYYRCGNKTDAEKTIDECIQKIPAFAPAWFIKADAAMKEGNIGKASDLYRKTLEANMYFSPAMTALGAISFSNGDIEAAEKYFRDAAAIAPRLCENRYGRGAALSAMSRYSEAAEEFVASLEINSEYPPARGALLTCCKQLYKNGGYEKAAGVLRTGIKVLPEDTEFHFWLVRILDRSGDRESAKKVAENLLRIDSSGQYEPFLKELF